MRRRAVEAGEAGVARPRRRRWLRVSGWVVLGVVLALVAVRLALPSWLRSYVNRTLDQSPDYDGQIGDVNVHLWRGAYTVHDVEIVKTTGLVPVPFFEGKRIDFSLDWGALLHGEARGKIVLDQPRVNFVDGSSPEETQTGANQPWLSIIHDLYPFRIDRAVVRQGELAFRAFHTDPPVDVRLTDLSAAVTNLTNVEDKLDPLIATVRARGSAMESGRFEFEMSLDPQSHRPNFKLAARLLGLDVTELTSLTRAYGGFEFSQGRFDLVVEADVKDGFLQGYAKPLFIDAKVLSESDLESGNPVEVLWEGLIGVTGEVFQNQKRDQFATSITLEGELDDPRTSLLEIVGNVLRNAFIEAYRPRYSGRIAPEVVPGDGESGAEQGD